MVIEIQIVPSSLTYDFDSYCMFCLLQFQRKRVNIVPILLATEWLMQLSSLSAQYTEEDNKI